MEALLALIAELWWVAPAAAATGGAGVLVVRGQRRGRLRRLELDAARGDVRAAREALARSRAGVHSARADLARAQTSGEYGAARRGLADAQHAAHVATADLVARRSEVRAARAALPGRRATPATMPLARLMARHDAVLSAWLRYETDAALAIAYPAMTDAAAPRTAAFLDALDQARWLRPRAATHRIAAGDYSAYRDAVRRMERAFAIAEHEARREAGDTRFDAPGATWAGAAWSSVAHDVVDGVTRVLAWSETVIGRTGASGAGPRRDARPPRA